MSLLERMQSNTVLARVLFFAASLVLVAIIGFSVASADDSISGTGYGSNNQINNTTTTNTTTTNNNNAEFTSNNSQSSSSGDATSSNNTTGGDATSGSSSNSNSTEFNYSATNNN